MSLAGPRLDRPSAIGDEGRPRAASLWIATVVVAAIVGIVGVRTDEPSLLPTLATLAGLTVAGVALLERESFVPLVVGHLLVVTFGSAFALLVLVGPFLDRGLFVVAGCALALLGIAAAWADVGGDDLERATGSSGMTYLSMIVSAIVAVVVLGVAAIGWMGVAGVVDVSAPVPSLGSFLLVTTVTAGCLLLAVRWLPVRQLTARSRRARVEQFLESGRRVLLLVGLGSFALLVVVIVLWLWVGLDGVVAQLPLLARALEGLSSPFVVWPLVAVGLGGALVGGLVGYLRTVTRQISVDTDRTRVATITGIALTVAGICWLGALFAAIVIGNPRLVWGLGTVGTGLATLLLVGPPAVLLVCGGGTVVAGLGLLPTRATGPAVAATGLLLAAIGLGRGDPLLVFACIAGAALVWDVSTFGLGLTAEVGHLPDTRRLELFHGAVAVGVAVCAVLVAIGLETIRTGLFAGIGGTGGAVVIALGALLLLVPLRG